MHLDGSTGCCMFKMFKESSMVEALGSMEAQSNHTNHIESLFPL